MKLWNSIFIFILVSACCFGSCKNFQKTKESATKLDYFSFPEPSNWVNDFEDILTEEEEKTLNEIVNRYQDVTTREIAIVTIETYEPYDDIQTYGGDLLNAWGIGVKDVNNGLLILVSKSSRKTSISTGYGTEKVLSDQICKEIIDEEMIPAFAKGEYYLGVSNGLKKAIELWRP